MGFLDPNTLLTSAGPWAVAVVCLIAFVESGLLIGFVLPGDTLLFFTGVLTAGGVIHMPVALVIALVAVSAIVGDQLGYTIGHVSGPRIFERRESGLFSRRNVARTQAFFDRFGGWAVTIARFVPVVRTFAPVAAGVGRMRYPRFLAFNVLGGVVWTTALILLGFGLGLIPGVAEVVGRYIDVVLVGVVALAVVGVLIAYLRERRGARS